MTIIQGVEVFHWNPRRRLIPGRIGRMLPRGRRVNNFGDMLGPPLVRTLAPGREGTSPARLFTVGSILHYARDGDVVWGSGINGKVPEDAFTAKELDVRAVRGPLTADFLRRRGIQVPEVFGDPGAVAPAFHAITRADSPRHDVLSLPNLHDEKAWRSLPGFLSPRRPHIEVMRTIAESRRVITSSLHGVIVAEALGVPVSLVRPGAESLFKYEDYFEGTGRKLPRVHDSHTEALRADPMETPRMRLEPLLESFPRDLWNGPELSSLPSRFGPDLGGVRRAR